MVQVRQKSKKMVFPLDIGKKTAVFCVPALTENSDVDKTGDIQHDRGFLLMKVENRTNFVGVYGSKAKNTRKNEKSPSLFVVWGALFVFKPNWF